MLRNKAERLIARRQQDVRDQCQDYMTSRYLQTVCHLILKKGPILKQAGVKWSLPAY